MESLARYDRQTLSGLLKKGGVKKGAERFRYDPLNAIREELETAVEKIVSLTSADRLRQANAYRKQLSKDAEHVRANVELTESVLQNLGNLPGSFAWIRFNFLPGLRLFHCKGWGFTESLLRRAVAFGADLQGTIHDDISKCVSV